MYNSRGQKQEYVNKSVNNNKKFEFIFKDHIKNKYNIDLDFTDNPFKAYDFKYKKIYKIEYKGLNYRLNNNNDIATCNKKGFKINDVFLSKSKIAYYKIRQIKNSSLKFFVVYGFYEENERGEIKKIIYKYQDITDLNNIILNYKQKTYENAKHYLFPIKDLKLLPDENPFNI